MTKVRKPLEVYVDKAIDIVSPLLAENQMIIGVGNFSPQNAAARLRTRPKVKLVEAYTRFTQDANIMFARDFVKSLG